MKKFRYAALGLLALLVFIDARLSASIECDEGFTYCIWGGLQAGYNTNQYSSLTEAFNDGPGESMCVEAFDGQAIYGSHVVDGNESCSENGGFVTCSNVILYCYSDGWGR